MTGYRRGGRVQERWQRTREVAGNKRSGKAGDDVRKITVTGMGVGTGEVAGINEVAWAGEVKGYRKSRRDRRGCRLEKRWHGTREVAENKRGGRVQER